MGTERSGRRKIEPPQGLVFPKIGKTEESIRRYLATVARYLGEGRLDPRVADSMIAAAKGALQAVRERFKRLEVNELQTLVNRAEAVSRAGRAYESDDRQNRVTDAAGAADAADPAGSGTTPN